MVFGSKGEGVGFPPPKKKPTVFYSKGGGVNLQQRWIKEKQNYDKCMHYVVCSAEGRERTRHSAGSSSFCQAHAYNF